MGNYDPSVHLKPEGALDGKDLKRHPTPSTTSHSVIKNGSLNLYPGSSVLSEFSPFLPLRDLDVPPFRRTSSTNSTRTFGVDSKPQSETELRIHKKNEKD